MKKIRLLFVAEELCMNGAMISLVALLQALPAEKYDISLFLFKHGGELTSRLPKNVKVLPELLPYAVHRMPLKDALRTMLKRSRFDMILYRILVSLQRYFKLEYRLWWFLPHIKSHFDVACCYTDGFVAPMILRKVDAIRKVCWVHYIYSKGPQPNYVYNALKKADMCVPVSIEAGKSLNRELGVNVRQHIVHNITDAAKCIERALEPCEKKRMEGVVRIVSVGRVTHAKFFELIPDTAQKLRLKGVNFEWYIIGDGDKFHELTDMVEIGDLSDCVHFIGARQNPMPWIKSADVFVNPSRYESWGMTVSEALCLGKAVITSDIPVFAEQITNEVNGLMCPAMPEHLADAIVRVLTDEQLKHNLEKNAAKYPFTKESIVAEFDALIEKLI